MARSGKEKLLIFFLTIVMLVGFYAGLSYLKKTYYDPYYIKSNAPEIVEKLQTENIIREGDIVFQSRSNVDNELLDYLNNDDINHVGVLILYRGKYHVIEVDDVVRFTPLEDWISKGDRGNFIIKRFDKVSINSNRLLNEGLKYSGKKNDVFLSWSDEMLYNAELVWKVIQHSTGRMIVDTETFGSVSLSAKGQELFRQTFGDNIPRRTQFVTPYKIFKSDKLVTIYSN